MDRQFEEFDECEFYKELYYHELDFKEKITTKITFAFAINTFLSGIIIYIYNKMMGFIGTFMGGISITLFVFLLIIFTISIVLILRSLFGYTYSYLPPATQINKAYPVFEKYYEENKEYFETNKIDKHLVIEDAYKKNISSLYFESADINRKENFKKSYRLRQYGWAIIAITIFISINLIFIGIVDFKEKIDNCNNLNIKTMKIMEGGEK